MLQRKSQQYQAITKDRLFVKESKPISMDDAIAMINKTRDVFNSYIPEDEDEIGVKNKLYSVKEFTKYRDRLDRMTKIMEEEQKVGAWLPDEHQQDWDFENPWRPPTPPPPTVEDEEMEDSKPTKAVPKESNGGKKTKKLVDDDDSSSVSSISSDSMSSNSD